MAVTTVLLVDVNTGRRARLRHFLSAHFAVEVCGGGEGALARSRELRPRVALLSLAQAEENGLVLARRLASEAPDPERRVVVYGRPSGKPISAAVRGRLERAYSVDRLLLRAGHPADIEGVIAELLAPERRRPEAGADGARLEVLSAQLPSEEPGWRDLLSAPASPESVKTLLTKEIGWKGVESEESWGELLRSDLSAESLKKLLGRRIF